MAIQTKTKPSPAPEKPKAYVVVDPTTDTRLPSFPSTANAACRNLEDYLQNFEDQGLVFLGYHLQHIGRETRNLLVFKRK